MTRKLHQLMQDNDGHWYVVPMDERRRFLELMDKFWESWTEEDYDWLEAMRVDGPHSVQFMWG